MTSLWGYSDEARRTDAAAWVARLEAGDLGETEAVRFDAWLSATPDNAAAFDATLAVSHDYHAHRRQVASGLAERGARRPEPGRRLAWGVGAAAAALALAVLIAPEVVSGPQTTTYATGKGERRTVKLADGSTIDLNAGTRLSVTYARRGRQVSLNEGQAAFDVVHDVRRPFVIAAGDRTIIDVGTQFDIRRRDGRLAVTVASGAVEIRPSAGYSGRAYRLHPGQRFEHVDGAREARVAAAEPAEVLGWRAGRLVYRDRPLSEVVADLNQQFDRPIRIEDPGLAATPVSGVLILDDQAAVIRRLALLVPIRPVRSEAGVLLRRDGAFSR